MLAALLLLLCPQGPVLERGPWLQRLGPDRVAVAWRTDRPADSLLLWGAAPGALTQSVADPAPATEHRLEIAGLPAASEFYYAVGSSAGLLAGNDPQHRFRTAQAPGTPAAARLWLLGDAGTGQPEQYAVRDAFLAWSAARPPEHLVLLGDNAYPDGSDADYQARCFGVYGGLLRAAPVWSARGNHDRDAWAYDLAFDPPAAGECGGLASGTEAWYSMELGDAHFVFLDSFASDRGDRGAMLAWLRADLAASAALWTVAFFHHPPYTKGTHDSDDPLDSEGRMIEMRENFLPVLEEAGADLVVSGHSHGYERSLLIAGHYGVSATFGPRHVLDGGDGRAGGDGAYRKLAGPRSGTVYVVAGSAGKTEPAPLDHPALPFAFAEVGSVALEFAPGRLDLAFVDAAGAVRDAFTLHKRRPPRLEVPPLAAGQSATLSVRDCAPAATVAVAISLTGAGPTSTPYGPASLTPPILTLASGSADAAGVFAFAGTIPSGAAGRTVHLQALERAGPSAGYFSAGVATDVR